MQRNLTSTIAGTPKQGRKLSPIVIGGAALVLAAAAGVATWQGIAQRETSTTVTESSVVEAGTVSSQPRVTEPRAADVTLYLAGSQAEAEQLTAAIAYGNRILDQFGKPVLNASVIVITSPEQESAIRRANADSDNIRASMGLPPVTVIDLRVR